MCDVQVEAATLLTVLALDRSTFRAVLGPLEKLLEREKSPQVRKRVVSGLRPVLRSTVVPVASVGFWCSLIDAAVQGREPTQYQFPGLGGRCCSLMSVWLSCML